MNDRIKDENLEHISRKGYYICLIFFLVFMCVFILLNSFGIPITKLNPYPCVLYTFFGFYCPGCGGTRAVMYLMNGELLKSFFHHPVVLYTAILLLVFMGSHTLNIFTKGQVKAMQIKGIYLYIMVAIIAVQCIVKNVCVLIYGTYPLM